MKTPSFDLRSLLTRENYIRAGLVLASILSFFAGQQNPPDVVVLSRQSEIGLDSSSLNCWPGGFETRVEPDGSTTVICIVPEVAARGTATPIPTKKPTGRTATPVPTIAPASSTPTALVTLTPGLTSTPGAAPSLTPTAVSGECPEIPNLYHPPKNILCQRWSSGVNPRAPEIVALFDGYTKADGTPYSLVDDFLVYGDLYAPMWLSSATEEKWGFTHAIFTPEGCPQNGQANSDGAYGCIVAILIRFHDPGTLDHLAKRFHSLGMVAKMCDRLPNGNADLSHCGIFQMSGEVTDYGYFSARYKQNICHLEIEPGYHYPESQIDQPSYRTSSTELDNTGNNISYWVSGPQNAVVQEFYDPPTNLFHHLAWASNDVWQLFPSLPGGARGTPNTAAYCDLAGGIEATKHLLSEVPPLAGMEHKNFQLVHLQFDSLPTAPGTYYYDLYGNEKPTCTEPRGWDYEDGKPQDACVPYLVAGDIPAAVMLKYDAFFRGDCFQIPCFTVDDFGLELAFPFLDGRGH